MNEEKKAPTSWCQTGSQFTVSRFSRRKFIEMLDRGKANHLDIKIRWSEKRYLFSSDFYLTVDSSDRAPVDAFITPFTHWAIRQNGMGSMKNREGSGFKAVLGCGQ